MTLNEAKVQTLIRMLEIKVEVLEESILEYEKDGNSFKFIIDEKKTKLGVVNEILKETQNLFNISSARR